MIQQVVNNIDTGSPTTDLGSITQSIARPAENRRIPLVLIGALSGLALLLAGAGIYAATAYGVAQRTRELGVRLALGAQPGGLVALVLRQGFRPIWIGLLVGAVFSVAIAFAMRGLLFGIKPLDAATFAVIPLVLVTISLIACWIPALRSTRVNLIEALRAE